MKRIIFLTVAVCLIAVGCKKEGMKKSSSLAPKLQTNIVQNLSTAAGALKGINWACTADNFCDTILVLSGLTSTDSYSTVSSKTDAILSGVITNTGANTIRIPINYPTVSQSWWNSYTAVIDKATSKGYERDFRMLGK